MRIYMYINIHNYIYIHVYKNTYMCVATINAKRRLEFERKYGEIYGKIWREERKRKMI